MRQLATFVCLCFLFITSTGLASQPLGTESPHQAGAWAMNERSNLGYRSSGIGLLYQFADEVPEAKRLVIVAEVRVDNVVAYVDHLEIIAPDPQAAPVVELFAHTPEIAHEIAHLAESGSEVIFDLYLGEQLIETVPGMEMIVRSEALFQSAATPQTVRIPLAQQAVATPKTFCYECYPQYSTCVANNCGGGMPQRLCDLCDRIYDRCLDTCDDCTPGQETYIGVDYADHVFTDEYDCLYKESGPGSATYRYTSVKYKETETIVTTHADCTTSTVENISYFWETCWWLWMDNNCIQPEYSVHIPYCF